MITVIIDGVSFELTVSDARLLYFDLQEKLYEARIEDENRISDRS